MKACWILTIAATVVLAKTAENQLLSKKDKRGINHFGPLLNSDPFNNVPSFGSQFWQPPTITSLWDSTVGKVQFHTTPNLDLQVHSYSSTPNIAYSPDVVRAIQLAKEASHNVHIAQHKVDNAKQAAILQQRIALVKEAAAEEAAHRSAEITAHAKAEARASTRQLVAFQQRLATLKDVVAAAQRLAAAREQAAAAAIQRSATNTAHELHKQDVDHQIRQSEYEAKVKDLKAAKENVISYGWRNNGE